MLRSRTAILGVKVSILYLFVFVSEKPCNQRLFSPLLRNKSTLFSHALGCLSAGNPLPTVRAVFDAVRGGRKERATHGTFLSVLGLIEFRIEQLIKNINTYQKTKPAYAAYRKAKDKEKYRTAHESDIILYEAAAKAIKAAGITKLPSLAALQAEYAALQEQKEALYADYGKLKKQVKEYDVIKKNIDSILKVERQPEREKEAERG